MNFYQGTHDRPTPPSGAGWAPVSIDDQGAKLRASGLLGQLPLWHYHDELQGEGLYRFFCFEEPTGRIAIGAERFVGTMGAGEGASGTTDSALMAAANAVQSLADPCNLTASKATVAAFQHLWNNTSDPNMGLPKLTEDGKYGTETSDSVGAATGGGAVGPCSSYTGGGGGGGGGTTTSEPIPKPTSSCDAWTADASNAKATAIAHSISYSNTPVAWKDQTAYGTTIDGVEWTFPMWWEGGLKMVSAYRCSTPHGGTSPAQAGMGAGGIIAGILIVGGIIVAAFAGRKPVHT